MQSVSAIDRFRRVKGTGITWPPYTAQIVVLLSALIAVWAAVQYSQSFMTGLIVGSLYALSAVGLTLIYSIARTPHFAHGDAMMMSAYFTYFALTGLVLGTNADAKLPVRFDQLPGATTQIWRLSFGYGFLLASVVSVVLTVPILLLINRAMYRPLLDRNAGSAMIAVASLGVAISIRGLVLLIWGATPRKYSTGIRDTVQVWKLPRVVADQYFILLVVVVLSGLVSWILFRTKLGTSMRAMADNPDLARASGIVAADVTRWTWIIGGVLITAAGTLLALQAQLAADFGFLLILPIFAAAIFGGVGSPQGAFLGGLIIGVVSEVAAGSGLVSPGYKIAVALVVLILVILIRPRGLMGAK